MIPLSVPNLTGNERKYLNQCIDTTFVSSVGEFVNRIEEMTAEKCGARYGVAVSSGTTGLHLALVGCGVKRDDLVIIPTFTFIATANAVAHCGAIPWLMDISPDSWTMDSGQLERELEENTFWDNQKLIHKETGRQVAAIMPVYTLGNVPDMDRIREIAQRYHLPVAADAAAALGAEYKGRSIGELADLTVISFNGNKTVTAGGGGMIVGNDEMLMKRLKHLSTTARVTAEYDHDMVGFNYRMTNIQAAVGCAQLERAEEFIEKKREIRAFYNQAFAGQEQVSLFPIPDGVKSSCWFSGIVLNEDGKHEVRSICQELKKRGIEGRTFWKPVHLQKPYENTVKAASLKTATGLWERILTLPCSTNITGEDLEYVVTTVKEILS
ncbi:LegC family aminotransferase [Lachnospiraceae bacterium 62-35]